MITSDGSRLVSGAWKLVLGAERELESVIAYYILIFSSFISVVRLFTFLFIILKIKNYFLINNINDK